MVPAGYNTDPAAFIGYTKLPLFPDIPDSGPDDSCMPANNEPPSEKDLARYQTNTINEKCFFKLLIRREHIKLLLIILIFLANTSLSKGTLNAHERIKCLA